MLALGLAVPCMAPPRPRAATISGLNLVGGSSHSALGVQPLPKSTTGPLMVWGAGHKAQAGRPPALTGTLQLERRGAGTWLPHTHAHPLVLLGTKPRGAPRVTAHSHCARWWLLIPVPDPFAGGHSSSPHGCPIYSLACMSPKLPTLPPSPCAFWSLLPRSRHVGLLPHSH